MHETETSRQAKEETGRAVAEDLAVGKQSLALTATRAEARDVNEAARFVAEEKGRLRGENVVVCTAHGERQFAEGDRVLFTRNHKALAVKNGDLGTVKSIAGQDGQARMKIDLDRGGERQVDTRTYDHLEHGYAVTVHKAQGSTVDRAHVLASDNGMSSREWAYVAGSRAREETHVHADQTTLADFAPDWARKRQKDVTLDYPLAQERTSQPSQRDYAQDHGLTRE